MTLTLVRMNNVILLSVWTLVMYRPSEALFHVSNKTWLVLLELPMQWQW